MPMVTVSCNIVIIYLRKSLSEIVIIEIVIIVIIAIIERINISWGGYLLTIISKSLGRHQKKKTAKVRTLSQPPRPPPPGEVLTP